MMPESRVTVFSRSLCSFFKHRNSCVKAIHTFGEFLHISAKFLCTFGKFLYSITEFFYIIV